MSEISDILDEIEAERTMRVERFNLIADLDASAGTWETDPDAPDLERLMELFVKSVEQTQAQFEAVAAAIGFDLQILERLALQVAELSP